MSETSDQKYKEKFRKEIKKYLNFSNKYKKLAEEIAAETAEMVYEAPSERVNRTSKLSFEQKVKMAANACIRHSYTDYDDILIEKTIEQSCSFIDDTYKEIKGEAMNEVSEFIRKHRE
jgi:hypothetical protein